MSLLGSIGISLASSAASSIFGSKSSKTSSSAANRSNAAGNIFLSDVKDYSSPYISLGKPAAFALQNFLGIAPDWTTADEQRLSNLIGQESSLRAQLAEYEAAMTIAGTSHATRHYAEWYGPKIAQVRSQLNEIDQLKSRKQAYDAYQDMEGEGGIENIVKDLPGYKFRLSQGLESVGNAQEARKMSLSGRALKEIERYAEGFASDEYGQHINRLFGAAGLGQNSVNTIANAGSTVLANTSGNINRDADRQISTSGDSLAGINNAIQTGYGNYRLDQILNNSNSPVNAARIAAGATAGLVY